MQFKTIGNEMIKLTKLHYLLFELHSTRPTSSLDVELTDAGVTFTFQLTIFISLETGIIVVILSPLATFTYLFVISWM